jgi:hypothetical protein
LKEHIASIFRVEEYVKQIANQEAGGFIVTAVTAPKPTILLILTLYNIN